MFKKYVWERHTLILDVVTGTWNLAEAKQVFERIAFPKKLQTWTKQSYDYKTTLEPQNCTSKKLAVKAA